MLLANQLIAGYFVAGASLERGQKRELAPILPLQMRWTCLKKPIPKKWTSSTILLKHDIQIFWENEPRKQLNFE